MRLIVGLGNPGSQYEGTRHNVGFDVIEELCQRLQAGRAQLKFGAKFWEAGAVGRRVLLAAPQTFMNRSGEAVQQLVSFFKILPEETAVVCDDMNLATGQLRWRASGSAGGQKGLADIIQRLGTDQVPRLRMGIGRPVGRMDATGWVLGRFRPEEKELMDVVVKQAADSVELALSEGIVAAMNRYNRATEA